MSAQRFEVHVDELVLHGLSVRDAQGVDEAVERELTRLLRRGPVVWESGSTGPLDAGSFEFGRESPAQAIATRVATSVHGSLAP